MKSLVWRIMSAQYSLLGRTVDALISDIKNWCNFSAFKTFLNNGSTVTLWWRFRKVATYVWQHSHSKNNQNYPVFRYEMMHWAWRTIWILLISFSLQSLWNGMHLRLASFWIVVTRWFGNLIIYWMSFYVGVFISRSTEKFRSECITCTSIENRIAAP